MAKEHVTVRLSAEVMEWVRAQQDFMEKHSAMHIRPSVATVIEWSLREAFAQRAALNGPPPVRPFVPVNPEGIVEPIGIRRAPITDLPRSMCEKCGGLNGLHQKGCKR